jgi:hypothetical protein
MPSQSQQKHKIISSFYFFKISKNENNVKMLSVVEYDFLYPNWLQSFLEKENLPGLTTISEKIEENLNIYLKLFLVSLLYHKKSKLIYNYYNLYKI